MTGAEVELTGTEEYYQRRAHEYDRVYRKPERQVDLRAVEQWLRGALTGSRVLEVAAGTGYWTQFFADCAASVTATDVNDATLQVAKSRRQWPPTVEFASANAFDLSSVSGRFDAAFVGFFWSHLRLDQLEGFVSGLSQRLEPSSRIILVDNNYVEGSNHPVTKTDAAGNTYQRRHLDDGSAWDVLKNFPSTDEIANIVAPISMSVDIRQHNYYWIADIRTR